MRCKACNEILQEEEIFYDMKHKKMEDLCRRCRNIVFEQNDENLEIVEIFPDIFQILEEDKL